MHLNYLTALMTVQSICFQEQLHPRAVYFLCHNKSESIKKYIEEELAKGLISPSAAGFFFVTKKDGRLRPCIDYRGLNEITVKFRYPLPLVPAALEQLRTAKFFSKLLLQAWSRKEAHISNGHLPPAKPSRS